jgi:predicted small lipoprotein YifL
MRLISCFLLLVSTLAMMLSLSACGIKGALYIPEQRYPQKNAPQKADGTQTQSAPSTSPSNTTTETK